jgi:hypothetical protein
MLIEIAGERFEYCTDMTTKFKSVKEFYDVRIPGRVFLVEELHKVHFGPTLGEHLCGVYDNFESNRFVRFVIVAFQNLTECTLPKSGENFITISNVIASIRFVVMSWKIENTGGNFNTGKAKIVNVRIIQDFGSFEEI